MTDDRRFRRHVMAIAALAAVTAYTVWRAGWTLGTHLWIAVPLFAAELVITIRFALGVVMTLPEPRRTDAAADDDPDMSDLPTVDLLVPATGADRDALTRTLMTARRSSAASVRVLDDRERPRIRREAERLGAVYEVHQVARRSSAALIEAARSTTGSEVLAWVDAGDVIVPGFLDLAQMLGDTAGRRDAVVQSATDLINGDSLLHLVPDRDERALENRVTGPSLGRSGAAPWHGSGSLVRTDALEEIGGLPIDDAATHRAAVRLDRCGWSVRWATPPAVRTIAADSLDEHLRQVGTDAHAEWRMLSGPDSVLRPVRTTLRRRAAQLHASTAVLDGLARLTAFIVLIATLFTGKLPFHASTAVIVTLFGAQLALRVAATVALGRGTVGVGDVTRQGLRHMGVHVGGLLRAPSADTSGNVKGASGGIAVLGRLRLLTTLLIAIDVALLARVATFAFPDLLPRFTDGGRFLTMAAAAWAIVVMVDVLQLLVGRVQRRADHRVTTELIAAVDGASCRIVDLTPHGVGLLLEDPPESGAIVDVAIDVPRLEGGWTRIEVPARIRHVATRDEATGRYRAGASFTAVDADARDALVEYCALIADQRDTGRVAPARTSAEDLVVDERGRPRRVLAGFNVVAVLLAGAVVAAGPAGAVPLGGGTAAITGRVLHADGSAFAGACVTSEDGPTTTSVFSGSDGTFELSGLGAGSYVVSVTDCGANLTVRTYSGSKLRRSEATTVTVAEGASAAVGDVTMHAAGQLTGSVVDEQGEPLASICVSFVQDPDGEQLWWPLATTGPDGRFSGPAPADVDGKVQMTDCAWPPRFANTWLPGVPSRASASTARPSADKASDVGSTTMVAAAAITGTIRDDAGAPRSDVCVSAQIVDGGGNWNWVNGANTGADGTFQFTVAPGTYSLWMSDCGSGYLISRWYPEGNANTSPPPTVDVPPTGTSIDATMARGGRASGTVLDDRGAPATNVCVSLYDLSQDGDNHPAASWDQVRADGTWTSAPVPPGSWVVRYDNCVNGGLTHDGPWTSELRSDVYPGSGRPWTLDQLRPVTIETGSTTTGVDDTLSRAAHLSGTLTRDGGTPAAGVCLSGVDDDLGDSGTTEDGTWSATVPPGSTTIVFSDCVPGRGLVQQVRTLELTGGEERRVDIDMTTGATSTVEGTLRNATGTGPDAACVLAYLPNHIIGLTTVDPTTGAFQLAGLADGRYYFAAVGCGDGDVGPITFPGDPTPHPLMWYPNIPIERNIGGVDPEGQHATIVEVRSTTPTPQLAFCIGDCPSATTTVPSTVAPVAPTTVTVLPPVDAATAPGAPSPTASGSRAVPRLAPLGSAGRRFQPPSRRPGPTITGATPTAAALRARQATTSTVSGPSSTTTSTVAETPTTVAVPPTVAGVSAVEPIGAEVARHVPLPTLPPESHGFPWDLFGGTVVAAGAAIGLILVWRRRHPNFG